MNKVSITKPRGCLAATALLCAALSGLSACASVQLAGGSAERDAKSFSVDPSRGRIYVVRPGKFLFHGASSALPVVVDGATVGANANATFLYVDVYPGLHRVSSHTLESFAFVELNVEAGRLYFVAQRSKGGLISPRVGLALVESSTGMQLVSKSRLVAGTITQPDRLAKSTSGGRGLAP